MKKAIIVTVDVNIRCKTEEKYTEIEYFGCDTTLKDLLEWIKNIEEEKNAYITELHIREDTLTLLDRIREERKREK